MFYHTEQHWTGATRATVVAARGLAARGEPVTVVCQSGSALQQTLSGDSLDVVAMPADSLFGRDAWRLRAVLKEKFVEVVFLHTEREQLAVSSAMRLAERGAIIRRIPAGGSVMGNRKAGGRGSASRLLFATEADRARSAAGDRALLAPLGVTVVAMPETRAAARADLGIADETQLIVCALDRLARSRVNTALRTLALLAARHPELRLVLVGHCVNVDDTRMHAAALGVTTLVRFLGERRDMSAVLAAADVGWVAAEGDDGAFACLDFMAAGVPIIAERSPLLSSYVPDGIAGVLLPQAEPSETASAVARFLANEGERVSMGNAGRTRAQRDFSEKAMVDGFVAAAEIAGDRAQWAIR
ncbi:MAG: glycosyltransferase [bacterium]